MNILFVRLYTNTKPEPLWYSYLQQFKKFFEQWLEYAMGAKIQILITARLISGYDVDYDELVNEYNSYNSFVVFLVDEVPDRWKGHAEGFTAPRYSVVKHTRSADWAPLYTTSLRLSHELWHWFGIEDGKAFHNRVEKANRDKLFEYWGEHRWWNFYYRLIRRQGFYKMSQSVAGITKYATLTGVLDE